jgi:hypothetical protein
MPKVIITNITQVVYMTRYHSEDADRVFEALL